MSGDEKPKSKKRRLFSLLFWFVIVVALALVALSLIPGRTPGRSLLSEMLFSRAPTISVSEFNFEVGRDRVFAHANGSIAAVGTMGLQVLGPDGQETLRSSYRAVSPAITVKDDFFLAYDIGGTSARVFNSSDVLSHVETEGLIVSASINKNGWFCVVTQERGGFRGTVYVYNNDGAQVYIVNIGSGFVLSAQLSADNKNLAILSMAEKGSQITYYNGIDSYKDEPDNIYEFGNIVVLDISFIANTKILAVSTQALHLVDFSGGSANHQNLFDGKRLAGYSYNEKFIAVHLYDYSIGYSGRTRTFALDGTLISESESSLEFISMASTVNALMILRSSGLFFYNRQLEEFPASETSASVSTASRVLALNDDMALVANDHFAIVIRRGEED